MKKAEASISDETSMNVMDAIYKRCSVRSYSPDQLDETTIRNLLAAAVRAPTAVHLEPWVFAVIQDKNVLKSLSDRAKPLFFEELDRTHLDRGGHTLEIFASPDFNIFYNAGTLIIICGKPMGPFVVADCWLAAENMMLAACAAGLGTCVIGSAVPALTSPDIKAELGIAAELTPIAPIIVGVPTSETPPTARKEPEILFWKR
ncbi:MAG TPA: nitroreductase family protein [Candidatus Binatia bacterium]